MFNDTTPPISRSIGSYVGPDAIDGFCDFVRTFNGVGDTTAEIAALNAAASDLETCSPSSNRRLVVYVTDEEIGQGDRSAVVQRLDVLTSTNGGGVFVSLWEPWHGALYDHYSQSPSLAVNGAFDPTNYSTTTPAEDRYFFTNLRARILYGE